MQYDGTCAFLTLDVWLTSQTSIRTWDQFAAEALLLLQLAYVVVRNKNGVYVDKRNKRKSKLKLRIIRVLNLPVSWAPQHRSQFSGQRHLDKKDDGDGDGDSDNHTTINSASNNRSRHTTSCSDGRGVSRGFGNQADGRGQDFPRHSSSSAFIPLVLPPAAAQGDEDHTRLMNKLPQYPPTLHHDHGHSHSHSHSSASFSSPSSPSALHSSRVLRRIARERAALQALVLESRIDVQDIKIIVTYHDSDPATATATATNPHHHDDADSSTSMSINTHTNIHAGATPNIDITTRANGGSSHRTHSMSTSHTDDQSGHYDDATGDHECVNGNIDGTNTASHSVSSVSTKMQEAMHEPSSVPSFSSFPSPSSSSSFACPSYVAHLNHLMREESTQRVRRIPRPSDSHSQHAQDSYVNIAEENYSGDVLFQTYLIFASLPSPSIVIAAEGSGVESNDHGIDDGNTTSNTNDNRCDENSGSASSTDRNGGTNMEAASSDDGNSSGGSGDEDAGADDAQVKENEKKTEGREQTTSETKLFVDSISADDNQAGMEWKTNDGNVSCDKTLKGPGAWSVSRIGVGAESGTETDARESKGPVRVDMNASERYLRMIREMTMGLPPTSLVCAGSQRSLMSRDI